MALQFKFQGEESLRSAIQCTQKRIEDQFLANRLTSANFLNPFFFSFSNVQIDLVNMPLYRKEEKTSLKIIFWKF